MLIHSILLIFIMWCNKKLHYEIFFFFGFFNTLLLRYGDARYHYQFLHLQRLKFSLSIFVQFLSFHHFFPFVASFMLITNELAPRDS